MVKRVSKLLLLFFALSGIDNSLNADISFSGYLGNDDELVKFSSEYCNAHFEMAGSKYRNPIDTLKEFKKNVSMVLDSLNGKGKLVAATTLLDKESISKFKDVLTKEYPTAYFLLRDAMSVFEAIDESVKRFANKYEDGSERFKDKAVTQQKRATILTYKHVLHIVISMDQSIFNEKADRNWQEFARDQYTWAFDTAWKNKEAVAGLALVSGLAWYFKGDLSSKYSSDPNYSGYDPNSGTDENVIHRERAASVLDPQDLADREAEMDKDLNDGLVTFAETYVDSLDNGKEGDKKLVAEYIALRSDYDSRSETADQLSEDAEQSFELLPSDEYDSNRYRFRKPDQVKFQNAVELECRIEILLEAGDDSVDADDLDEAKAKAKKLQEKCNASEVSARRMKDYKSKIAALKLEEEALKKISKKKQKLEKKKAIKELRAAYDASLGNNDSSEEEETD